MQKKTYLNEKKWNVFLYLKSKTYITQELARSMSATTNNKTFDVDEFNRNVQQSIALRKQNNSVSSTNNTPPIKDSYARPQITTNKYSQQRPDNEWFDYDAFVTWVKSQQILEALK